MKGFALEPGHHHGVKSLFLCDSTGRIVSRRAEKWFSRADACLCCFTTARPHEARGLCHRCYAAWKYRNNFGGCADKSRARLKAQRLTDEGDRRQREHEARRMADPRQVELIRQTKLRWAKRNAKFAAGKRVSYGIIPGHWIQGTILENGRGPQLGPIADVCRVDPTQAFAGGCPLIVAIVGSRDYPDWAHVAMAVDSLAPSTIVVSGAARGVDTVAANRARSRGLEVVEFPADWRSFGNAAGMIRNRQIVERCDWLIAFWYRQSKGTANSIDLARAMGKPALIFSPQSTLAEIAAGIVYQECYGESFEGGALLG